jgi:hypothetical protein
MELNLYIIILASGLCLNLVLDKSRVFIPYTLFNCYILYVPHAIE